MGWIDKEEDGKRFVNVAFPDKDVHLTLPKEIPITWLRQRVCREVAIRTNPPQADNVVCNDVPADWVGPGGGNFQSAIRTWKLLLERLPEVENRYQDAADKALVAFVKRPYVLVPEAEGHHWMHDVIGQTGVHRVNLRLTLRPDKNGQWLFSYRFVKVRADGQVEQIFREDVSSMTYPDAQPGKPILLKPVLLDVRFVKS